MTPRLHSTAAAAMTPVPAAAVPGAAANSPVVAGEPGGNPAGGAATPPAPPPAGPRTWVIELPAGTVLLTSNHRLHRMKANAITQDLKNTAATLARQQRIPRLGKATIVVSYLPPPRVRARRHPLASARVEDPDSLTPTGKALIDGITQAQVWPADTRKHVLGVLHRLEPGSCPRGRLRMYITEVCEVTG